MKPTERKKFFAHQDMTMEEYGLWTFAREVSYESGVFYGSGPEIAERFSGEGKNPIYRVVKNLVHKGWFQVLKKSKRDRKTGIYKPAEYRPLSPQEWTTKYPERVRKYIPQSIPETGNGTIPQTGNGKGRPVPEVGTHHSSFEDAPFPESVRTIPQTGNKSDKENLKGRNGKGETETTAPEQTNSALSSEEKTGSSPIGSETKTNGYGHGSRWLPLAEMEQVVLEETGHKVFFPAIYHGEIRRLAEKYGRDEMVAAIKELLLNSRETPDWRDFAGWLLNSECPRLRTILAARRLPSNYAQEKIEKAAMGKAARKGILAAMAEG